MLKDILLGVIVCVTSDMYAMTPRAHMQCSLQVSNWKLEKLQANKKQLQERIRVEKAFIIGFTGAMQEIQKRKEQEKDPAVKKYFKRQYNQWQRALEEKKHILSRLEDTMSNMRSEIEKEAAYRMRVQSLLYPIS